MKQIGREICFSQTSNRGFCECSEFTIIFYGIGKKAGKERKFWIHV